MLKYCDKDGIEKTIIDNENINEYVSGSGVSDEWKDKIMVANDDLKIINDNGDIEIGESSDVNTHVTRITNDCNMAFDLTVNGDMVVSGEIDQVGTLANLTTDAKTDLVSAVNEVNAKKDVLYADSPIGSIIPYGGTTAPDGFLLCQGQSVSRTTYAELFKVIGTSFGSGDGSTTFNVPDLRETVPVGTGTRGSGVADHDAYTVGQFKDDQLQEHTHKVICEFGADPNPNMPPNDSNSSYCQVAGLIAATRVPVNKTVTTNTGRTGTTTHGKQLGVNYIIKATQVSIPADFAPVDAVENGNMRAVTSNAVAAVNMDSAITIDTTKWSPAGQIHAFKVGQLGVITWGGNSRVNVSTDVNNTTKVAQLPVGFRPGSPTTGTLMTINGTIASLTINPAGEVTLCCPSNTLKIDNWAWGEIVFAIGN